MSTIQLITLGVVGLTILTATIVVIWDVLFNRSPKRPTKNADGKAKLEKLSAAQVRQTSAKFSELQQLLTEAEIVRHSSPGQADFVEAEQLLRAAALQLHAGRSECGRAMLDDGIEKAKCAITAFKKTAGIELEVSGSDEVAIELDVDSAPKKVKKPDELDRLPGLDDHEHRIDS